MQWDKGDILYGRKNSDAVHPIIFLDGHDDSYFIGAMITTSGCFSDNTAMLEEHFEEFSENGEKYELYFSDTYLVEAKLLKRLDWQPFRIIGRLTQCGVNFVESVVNNKYPKVWEDYLRR